VKKRTKKIVITERDYTRLERLIASARLFRQRDAEHLDGLEEELDRAIIANADELPHDVVTMNSRVRVKDLGTGREQVYEVVLSREADVAKGRISVLAPIGTALLGYGAGTTVEWKMPAGMRRLHIMEVEHQPEGAQVAA